VSFNIYSPYPGTELFRMAAEQGLPEPRALQEWARANFRKVPPTGAHVPPQTRKLIAGLDFPLAFSMGRGQGASKKRKHAPAIGREPPGPGPARGGR